MFQTSKIKPEQYIVDKIISKCPDWTYIHYTDEEVIQFFNDNYIEEFKYIVDKFNQIHRGAHKADLFRYYHLYITGGVFMDSDAMIEMNIDDIVKDYDFFSVESSYCPRAIFQGFIGSTPNHIIIYQALQDAYNIDINKLANNYLLICYNLTTIINNNLNNPDFNCNIKLYSEKLHNFVSMKCCNDEDETMVIHYYRDKIIPK